MLLYSACAGCDKGKYTVGDAVCMCPCFAATPEDRVNVKLHGTALDLSLRLLNLKPNATDTIFW